MINLFELKKQNIHLKNPILKNIKKVLESGTYILGKEVKKFEIAFAKYCKSKYAVAVKRIRFLHGIFKMSENNLFVFFCKW